MNDILDNILKGIPAEVPAGTPPVKAPEHPGDKKEGKAYSAEFEKQYGLKKA